MNTLNIQQNISDDSYYRSYSNKTINRTQTKLQTNSLTNEENKIISSFLSDYQNGSKTIEKLTEKNIAITKSNLEAVYRVLEGTTLEDAQNISKLILYGDDSKLKDNIKSLLAKTLAQTTYDLMITHPDITLKESMHRNISISDSAVIDGQYVRKLYGEWSCHIRTRSGYFIDDTLGLDKDSKVENLEKNKVLEQLSERYNQHIDELLDEMDNYGFETLVHEAILGADGTFSTEEIDTINKLPYKLYEEQVSYTQKINHIKELCKDEQVSAMKKIEYVSEKLHDLIMTSESIKYVNSEEYNSLIETKYAFDQLYVDFDEEKYHHTLNSFTALETKALSKSKLIKEVFSMPNGKINPCTNIIKGEARFLLDLVAAADINLDFDTKPSEVKLENFRSFNTFPQAKLKNKSAHSQISIHNQKVKGRQLLNRQQNQEAIKEYYMNMLNIGNTQILDVHYINFNHDSLLDFGQFTLNVSASYHYWGLAKFQISVRDYEITFNVYSDNTEFIEVVKNDVSHYTKQLEFMGFKSPSFDYHRLNQVSYYTDNDGRKHKNHIEVDHNTTLEVTL